MFGFVFPAETKDVYEYNNIVSERDLLTYFFFFLIRCSIEKKRKKTRFFSVKFCSVFHAAVQCSRAVEG